MPDPAALRTRINLPSIIRFDAGHGGLTRATVTAKQAEAEVYLHGAHVTHYQPHGQKPVLFLSEKSAFAPGKPIRGGVPVIFPWFGTRQDDPAAPLHGLVRQAQWSLDAVEESADGAVRLTFSLDSSRVGWAGHDFSLRYTVEVGASLDLELAVQNRSRQAFVFEEALHPYFAVEDAQRVTVTGLAGKRYLDKTRPGEGGIQHDESIVLAGETDRVYFDSPSGCVIHDPAGERIIRLVKRNSGTTVVWNPWKDKARALPDFGDDEWSRMVCVEPANAGPDAVRLEGGRRYAMGVAIRAGR